MAHRASTALLSFLLLTCLCGIPSFAGPLSLYDNLNQPSDGTCGTDFAISCAQRFETGTASGYSLLSVTLPIYQLNAFSDDTSAPTLSIYSDDSLDLVPLAILPGTLTLHDDGSIPQGAPGAAVRFDGSGIFLLGNTSYWLVLSDTGDTEWSFTNCPPGGDNSVPCPAATLPGDPASAVGFSGTLWFPAESGTQQMKLSASAVPEPSTLGFLLCGLAFLGVRRARQ